MAGYGSYGYCSGHSRWFWGLRLHLVTTPAGLPVPYALTSATTNERDTVLAMFHLDADVINRPGQTLKADKGYRSAAFEAELNAARITLIRLALKSETIRPGQRFLRPFRQIIESVNQTLKAQLRPRTPRPTTHPRPHHHHLAPRNNHGLPARSLTAYDH